MMLNEDRSPILIENCIIKKVLVLGNLEIDERILG